MLRKRKVRRRYENSSNGTYAEKKSGDALNWLGRIIKYVAIVVNNWIYAREFALYLYVEYARVALARKESKLLFNS